MSDPYRDDGMEPPVSPGTSLPPDPPSSDPSGPPTPEADSLSAVPPVPPAPSDLNAAARPWMPPEAAPAPRQYAPLPPATPPVSAPQTGRTSERRRSLRVLVFCLALPLSCLLVCLIVLSATGISIDRADNGTLRLWLGPESTMRPVVTAVPTAPAAVSPLPASLPPGGELSAEQVYQKVAPSVVGILSSSSYGESSGSGMVLEEDGYILTNHHVVTGADDITVVLPDGEELEAKLIGSDYLTDIAVLKVERTGLPAIELGNSEAMTTGAKCYAIGNPLGMTLQNTFTDGMISAINRDIVLSDDARGEIMMTVLQTNCAVNPGNSGGPLLNRQGQVIGIVSSKIMGDYYTSVEGLGFAIPMDTAVPIINSLIAYGYVKGRPMIGITPSATQLDEQTAAEWGVPLGVAIGDVDSRSDAYRKGIRKGDIVTHVNDEEVSSVLDINRIKNRFKAGDTLKLTVYSKGTIQDIDVVLGDASDQ